MAPTSGAGGLISGEIQQPTSLSVGLASQTDGLKQSKQAPALLCAEQLLKG